MAKQTLDDVLRSDDATIPGTVAASLIPMSSTRLIGYAREKPEKLPFEFIQSGNRVHVPRVPFLRWLLGDEYEERKNKARRQVELPTE